MFGLSFAEIAVIVLVIVVIFGPEKLPEVARLASKGYREARKLTNAVRDAVSFEDDFRPKESYTYIVEKEPLPDNRPVVTISPSTQDDHKKIYAVKLSQPTPHEEAKKIPLARPDLLTQESHREVHFDA